MDGKSRSAQHVPVEFDPLDAMMNSQGALRMSAMKWIKERRFRIRIEIESKKSTIGGGFLGFESHFRFG